MGGGGGLGLFVGTLGGHESDALSWLLYTSDAADEL